MAAMEEEELPPSLENVVLQHTLRWIFVGGKGGVGKTTTSCCLGIELCKVRRNVLLISTDPAHNLSDAFNQKFSSDPILVEGYGNLYCMEVDSKVTPGDVYSTMPEDENSEMQSFLSKIMKNVPGIDELMGFVTVFKHVQQMEFDCIVFDTAPTGHTLKLLSFPSTMNSVMESLSGLRNRMGGLMDMMTNMMGQNSPSQETIQSKLDDIKVVVDLVNKQFKDPDVTTFVCVCIPEFLSLFETERLVQELTNYDIDTHNIVVNQVLYPNRDSPCSLCLAREKMQQKYIDQIDTLYEDFHITKMPLLQEEVRGKESLERFSGYLVEPYRRP
eukprot:gb/GECG01016817.1/.p1 GENE.gb/GECG01016817.1/~~gb/GECG01016817.1/.p1  ORF type:complete len:329 (+),score=35.96 gb/GECG01016817.1/:1-987(+)